MKVNRTQNAKRNIVVGIINKCVVLILPFIVRTVFIYSLGSEYLGLNSLFTSILSVLNVTELGFSSAVVYCMYEPIAKDDTAAINALLKFYKKVYFTIGVIIFALGIILMPFLPYLINGGCPPDLNLYILFFVYLLNTCVSYFLFAYKKSILEAFQRRDIIDWNNMISVGLMNLIQLILLLIWKNPKVYYIYLLMMLLSTILNNILNSKIVDKKYPQYYCDGELGKEVKQVLKKQVSGLMITRVCQMTRTSCDSIFISAFVGLTMTTIYGNYNMIVTTLVGVMNVLTNAMLAGVGNSIVSESEEKNYKDFKKFNFIYMWISGWSAVTLFVLYQNFMKVWVGDSLMLTTFGAALFTLYYYALKIGDIRAVYSDAIGLWWENRNRAIAEMLMNILLNFVLGKLYGIYGIVLATIIPLVTINFTGGTQILFKNYFKSYSLIEYFVDNAKYFFAMAFSAVLTSLITYKLGNANFVSLILRVLVCCIIPNFVFWLCYRKQDNYKEAKRWILKKYAKH